jgi:glycosyltransferase involved in cell wall biosynthesis
MNGKRILIVVPGEFADGGINNYFKTLKDRFNLPIDYVYRGARYWPFRSGFLAETKRIITDLNIYYLKLKSNKYDIVQTNTSLGWASVIRDGLYLLLAQKRKIKTIVFYRGWDINFEKALNKFGLFLFKRIFFKTEVSIVLSAKFKSTLISWGYLKEIVVETTLFDESLLKGIDIKNHIQQKFSKKRDSFTILFLARLERKKGIYEAIETFKLLKVNNKNSIKFIIAGSGKEYNNVKKTISEQKITDIDLIGHVEGISKVNALLNGDLYLFPTYSEGMPNSILEALAFGLPIVTRSVGAIPEIIDSRNGFHTDSYDPRIFANYIQSLIDDQTIRYQIASTNVLYAKNKFYSSSVLNRIEKIYNKMLICNN